MKWEITAVALIALAVLAVVLLGTPWTGGPKAINMTAAVGAKPLERIIVTGINGSVIQYREAAVYDEVAFKTIVKGWDEASDKVVDIVLNRYKGTKIVDAKAHYIEGNDTIVVEFRVLGKAWSEDNRGYADFLWLLTPLRLDFIDSHFEETNEGLFWNGILDGVNTSVKVLLPPQSVPYRAWQEPIGHCHGHVWWGRG